MQDEPVKRERLVYDWLYAANHGRQEPADSRTSQTVSRGEPGPGIHSDISGGEIRVDRGGAKGIQICDFEESRERSDTTVPTESHRILPGTDRQAYHKTSADRAIEESAIQEASIHAAIYSVRY